MTEAEWEAGINLAAMESALGWHWSRRKDRLLAVACCRAVLGRGTDDKARRAVDLAELAADDEEALRT